MTLNPNAEVDTDQVQNAGRGRGGGRAGLPIPIPIGGRGGWIGLVVFAVLLIGGLVGGNQFLGGDPEPGAEVECPAGSVQDPANIKCRNALYVNSIQNYWQGALPEVFGTPYQMADTVFFEQAVTTACGTADSGVGPFYCPADDQIYIDVTFWNELANRFGADGEFAQPYVLAHEYGHHVQDLLGTEATVRSQMELDPANQDALSVALELQADCYAGVWAQHAERTTDENGQPIFLEITEADIAQGIEAARAVGDDAIQQKMGGPVIESQFTHGSSAQREEWFTTGYGTGDPNACNTFA